MSTSIISLAANLSPHQEAELIDAWEATDRGALARIMCRIPSKYVTAVERRVVGQWGRIAHLDESARSAVWAAVVAHELSLWVSATEHEALMDPWMTAITS